VTDIDYEEKPEKRFRKRWVFGGIFILLFGACSYAFVGMFKNIGVVKPINEAFTSKVLSDGLPPANESVYSIKGTTTDSAVESVNKMISTLGAPDEISEANCNANSSASTNDISGEFVTCAVALDYAISTGSLTTRWRKEKEEWKLLAFQLNIDDVDAYTDLVVEKKISEEKAQGEP